MISELNHPCLIYENCENNIYSGEKFIKFIRFIGSNQFLIITNDNKIKLVHFVFDENENIKCEEIFETRESHFIYDFDT
jgi:hypothetical protein